MQEIDLCSFFLSFSNAVWDRLAFCRQQGIRTTETAITQDMVFEFWRYAKSSRLPVFLYEARNESANGNDLEFLIETTQGFLLLAMQAKIIKEDGTYRTLPHSVNGTEQIDLLRRYAQSRGGCAAYLFYNYLADYMPPADIGVFRLSDQKDFGCTVAAASMLKEEYYIRRGKNAWRAPSFESLHRSLAIPLHWIICTVLKSPHIDEELLAHIGYEPKNVQFYRYAELINDKYWKNMLSGAAIGRVSPMHNEESHISETLLYTPKYRVVLLRKPLEKV